MGSLGVGQDWVISLSCIGEGNGNPFQYSSLENPRDRGAWWAAVYGVVQTQTQLKWLSSSSNIIKKVLQSALSLKNHVLCKVTSVVCNSLQPHGLYCLGTSVCGTSQARTLNWVAISFSRGTFLTQGLNLCLLHLQARSLPLVPPVF